MVINELSQKNLDGGYSSSIATYSFDSLNRIITENNTKLGINNRTYNYNIDGSIDKEVEGSKTKKYVYKNGRLDYFYMSNPPYTRTDFGYDKLGNYTYYKIAPSTTANME